MTSLTSYINKLFVAFVALLVSLQACVAVAPAEGQDKAKYPLIAVLPMHNLSGSSAPLKDMRLSLIEKLRQRGVPVLGEDELDGFMTQHRIRYIGGIDAAVSKALDAEKGVKAVLITSLTHFDDTVPPKFAIFARLVSTGEEPKILWVDSVGLAGDDSPGLLDLGLIENPIKLRGKALDYIDNSLSDYLNGRHERNFQKPVKGKFRPKIFYDTMETSTGTNNKVAVAPFFNRSGVRNAGDIMTLTFVEQLFKSGRFEVIEPGIVRQAMLDIRLVLSEGVSFSDADGLFSVIDANFILSGKLFDYHDYPGPTGTAKVNFSALMLEKKTPAVVWLSDSYNQSDDGVIFFDWGRVNTAHVIAAGMAKSVVELLMKH